MQIRHLICLLHFERFQRRHCKWKFPFTSALEIKPGMRSMVLLFRSKALDTPVEHGQKNQSIKLNPINNLTCLQGMINVESSFTNHYRHANRQHERILKQVGQWTWLLRAAQSFFFFSFFFRICRGCTLNRLVCHTSFCEYLIKALKITQTCCRRSAYWHFPLFFSCYWGLKFKWALVDLSGSIHI